MNILLLKFKNYFYALLCFFSTWIIVGAVPAFHLEGMFKQVDTQILLLHLLGCTLFIVKGIEFFFNKESTKEINNIFFLIPFFIGVLTFFSAIFNDYFYTVLLGSSQIGQGAFWYFDFAILILFFSSVVCNYKLRLFFFLNILALTTLVTVFTLTPFWKGINISFFYFNDYLCYFGIISFILFTSLIKKKLPIFLAYCFLGFYLSLLDNRAATILWGLVFFIVFIYELLHFFRNNGIITKCKNLLFSNFVLTLSVFLSSSLILASSLIFWRGEGSLPSEIAGSALASIVVRGKLVEVVLSDFLNFKNILLGEGWGRVPDLLLIQMNTWQFDQLTVGFNLHFHTHNEMFEHFFSLGVPGLILFLFFIFYILKNSEFISIYNKISWLLFFYVSCFWFFWAGTMSIFALAVGTLASTHASKLKFTNKDINKILFKYNYFISLSFFILGLFLLYGAYLTYSYTKEYKKISYGELAKLSSKQNISEITCKNFYVDRKGGEAVARFVNAWPAYLKRNKMDYNEAYIRVLKALQCISEDIIFNSEASMSLLSSSILLDTKLFFSNSNLVKEHLNSEENYENLRKKVLMLANKAPKRGDLIMPFIAISLNKNRLDVINEICNIKGIIGIEGYCNLISAYSILNSKQPTNSDIKKSIDFLKKAVNNGILEEKVYGWWFFDELRLNADGYTHSGIPLSPDIVYYISSNEALKLLEIIENSR